MPEWPHPDVLDELKARSADGRQEIALALYPKEAARHRAVQRAIRGFGAVALGVLSAGFSILLVVIILNLIFHFVPS